jgi:hypothetical protein
MHASMMKGRKASPKWFLTDEFDQLQTRIR